MDNATDDGIEPGTADEWTPAIDGRGDGHAPDDGLEAVVVRYRCGPDRCTLVPRGGGPEALLSAWLSADLETVVDLDDAR